MKYLLLLVVAANLFLGCHMNSTSEPGIRYGMSKEQVIEQASRTDKIISTDGDTVVTEGFFSPTQRRARKTFTFHEGKLATVKHTML